LVFSYAFCILTSTMVYAYPEGWSDDMLISPDSLLRDHPDAGTDSLNNVWVVWDSLGWGTGIVYFAKLDSLGNVIIPETQLTLTGYSRHCRMAVDNSDNVHIVWRELSGMGFGLGYAKVANDGSVLIPPHLAIAGAGASNRPFFDMAFDHDRKELHILWEEIISGYEQMSYSLLDSLGDPIVSRVIVPNPYTNAYWGGIGIDNDGSNHIAYRSDTVFAVNRLMYKKLDRAGTVLIPNTIIAPEGASPSIVCDEHQSVHIHYINNEGVGNHVFYLKLDNDGNILIPPTRISLPTDTVNDMVCSIIDREQYLQVVWKVSRSQQSAWILYTKMDTSGNLVVTPQDIVYPPHTFWVLRPRITCDLSNRLHLVWMDGRIDTVRSIYYKRGENEQAVEEWSSNILQDQYYLSVSPNPFRDAIYIKIECPDGFAFSSSAADNAESVTLRIYDVTGRHLRSFHITPNAVCNTLQWDGTDQSNRTVPEGVYYIVLKNSSNIITKKIVKLQ